MAYPPDNVECRGTELVVGRMKSVPNRHPRFVVTLEAEVEVYEPTVEEAVKEALASLDADASILSGAVVSVREEPL